MSQQMHAMTFNYRAKHWPWSFDASSGACVQCPVHTGHTTGHCKNTIHSLQRHKKYRNYGSQQAINT